jgi:putative DNA methylase
MSQEQQDKRSRSARPAHAPPPLSKAVHFVTIRLAGIVAAEKLDELRVWREEQLELTPDDPELAGRFQTRIRQRFFTEYDRLLDDSRENELLLNKRLAAMVRRQLVERRHEAYDVLAYAILPNHVHVVLEACGPAEVVSLSGGPHVDLARVPLRADEQPDVRSPLVDFLRQLKTDTADQAGPLLEQGQQFAWHDESFDYWLRSQPELDAAVDYIAYNPVAAGLVRAPEQWFFCSAHERFLHDGEANGWLPRR